MPDNALNLAQVLWDERTALAGQQLPRPRATKPLPYINKDYADLGKGDLNAIYRILNKDDRWALCLSGGGIRSAALALGIVQFFARHRVKPKKGTVTTEPLLKQFDYLSTVSGGGYLGCWLSAWLFQERRKSSGGGADAVVTKLSERIGDHEEAEPIVNLRRDSHYLAPSFSAISPDVWADIATVVRNLVLVWLLVIPPLILAALVSKGFAYGFWGAVDWAPSSGRWLINLVTVASSLCFIFSLTFAVANRPTRGLSNSYQAQFLKYDLGAFLGAAALLLFVLAGSNGEHVTMWWATTNTNIYTLFVPLAVGVYGVSWFAAYLWSFVPGNIEQAERHRDFRWWHPLVDLGAWCLAGAAFGGLVATGYVLLNWLLTTNSHLLDGAPQARPLLVVVCGIPWILAARVIADVVFLAPATFIPRSDGDLEYQARAGGVYTLVLLGWLIWFGLVLFASWFAHWWLASVGGISGAASVIIGSSSKTPALVQDAVQARRYLTLNRLAAIAAAIFRAVLIVAVAAGVDWAFFPQSGQVLDDPEWFGIGSAGISLVFVVFFVPWVININRFSLHGLYRNRLVRTFLGASRVETVRDRTKNHFTDFDTEDSPRLHELWERAVEPCGDHWKPLHIINVALNLVSSKNLAWQERMAAPFTFSPLHAGSGSSAFAEGAFRRSYERDKQKPYGGDFGLTLGTAMAISGAAVSPNMGYNSSPGVAFLMTLFNVRLGWWLPNPRSGNPYYWYSGPGWALKPLVMEMFGLTNERRRWIYLSDGAHFENLGLYEMIRRRCRVIVISDGGFDPDYQFEDLGNALRKIWIDLGVRIEFVGLDCLKKRFKERPTPAVDEVYWAVGRIRYGEADESRSAANPSDDGLLLYFKAGLHGTEPMDVLSYAMKHPTFPHETTTNQFFSESQLEAYRALGYDMAATALCYAERERQLGAATGQQQASGVTQSLKTFGCSPSTITLREIIEKLEAQLLRSASSQNKAC